MDITKNMEYLEISNIISKKALNPAIEYALFLAEVIPEVKSRNETLFSIALDISRKDQIFGEDMPGVVFPDNINLMWYVEKKSTVNVFDLLEEKANQMGDKTLAQILALEILSKALIKLEIRTSDVKVKFSLLVEGENGRQFETDATASIEGLEEIFLK